MEFAARNRARSTFGRRSFGICNGEDDDIGIDIGTQLGRDLRDVLLLIVSPDPRQHGDCKGESDHNPVAG